MTSRYGWRRWCRTAPAVSTRPFPAHGPAAPWHGVRQVTPSASRVALVTGAARGIGAATVDALCLRGYHVVAVDSCAAGSERGTLSYDLATPGELDAVADRHPGRVLPMVADVRDRPALAAAAQAAVDRFGRSTPPWPPPR